jgi:ribosomal-protein-alanine N-acetyltransferase
MSNKNFEIETLSDEHLAPVAELEQLCFSRPISKDNLKAFLIDGIGRGFVSVETKSGEIAAYGGVIVAAGEAQILNIATHPSYRRLGLGRKIMQCVIEYSKLCEAEYITLEVREGNTPAVSLYEVLGFEAVGKIKGYYKDPVEDALIMKKELCN